MRRLSDFLLGVQQFGRTGNPQTGPVHPIGELGWLTRRAVQEDMTIGGVKKQGSLATVRQRILRALEVGFVFDEIFLRREYAGWRPESKSPRIIDLGGDIGGVSLLYWKLLAPNARITLIEANPSTATVALEFLRRKAFEDVIVINAAAAEHEGQTIVYLHRPDTWFHISDFTGKRAGMDHSRYYAISVPTIQLSTVIGNEKVDLLKMDIEGAEGGVMRELAASGKLGLVNQVVMEFHNTPDNPTNSLSEVLQILENANFTIEEAHKSGTIGKRGKRLRLTPVDVYAVKPSDKLIFTLYAKRSF